MSFQNNDHPYMIYYTLTGRISPVNLAANTVLPPSRSDDPHMGSVVAHQKHRNGKVQESATGRYPHAGILSMFQYLRRYPTTVTNRNRLRARMVYRHLLGIDVMALAPQVTDAAAVAKKYDNPTLQAPECVATSPRDSRRALPAAVSLDAVLPTEDRSSRYRYRAR